MNNNKFLYFMAGTGIGALLGVLFAPDSGSEIRNKISSRAQDGVDTLSRKVGEGRRYIEGSDIGKRTSDTIRSVVEKGRNVANLGRQRLNDSIEAGRSRFNESMERDENTFRPDREKDISAV
jgi:gas vesicle protein